jgi:hypothetical protein
MVNMKATQILLSTLLGYALWFTLVMVVFSSAVFAQSNAYKAIQLKDGKANAELFQDAVNENIRPELRAELAPIVAAIRYAENGKTYQYGIIHKRCPKGYRPQAGWCSATVQKHYDRWVKGGRKGDFVVSLGARYCPIGADNDPDNLNRHWIGNVKKFQRKFK